MKSLRKMDSAGWGVFFVLFILLSPPLAWAVWYYTLPTETAALRIASGIFLAATLAAFLTYGLNEFLWRRQLHAEEQEEDDEEEDGSESATAKSPPTRPKPAKSGKKSKKKKKRK